MTKFKKKASPVLWTPSPLGEGERERQKLFDLHNLSFKGRAKNLRKLQTPHEKLLWHRLRAGRLMGYKFRRQFPIGAYILDFFCYDKLFAIELDGSQHLEEKNLKHDQRREVYLRKRGIRILRIQNNELKSNVVGVLETILRELAS